MGQLDWSGHHPKEAGMKPKAASRPQPGPTSLSFREPPTQPVPVIDLEPIIDPATKAVYPVVGDPELTQNPPRA